MFADQFDFDFAKYVQDRKQAVYGGDGGARYAYEADIHMLRTFRQVKPVELAVAAAVRTYKEVARSSMLGTMIRVGPNQFPKLHKLVEKCAATLGVSVPT